MKRTLITIEQMEYDDDRHEITISGEVDGYLKFFETFDTSKQQPIKIFEVTRKDIDSYKTNECATPKFLLRIFNLLMKSKKTDGRMIDENESNLKFPFSSQAVIRNFERLAKIKFDYSKFHSLKQFQDYLKNTFKF